MTEFGNYIKLRDVQSLVELVRRETNCSAAVSDALRDQIQGLFAGRPTPLELSPTSDRDVILVKGIRHFLQDAQITDGEISTSRFSIPECETACSSLVGPFGNSPIEWLNLVVNALVGKTNRTSVVSAIKDEGPWLIEWIAHYKALGVDNIIIYYNDCTDGSAELLQALAKAKEIVAIENFVAPGVSPQRQAFAHAMSLLRLPHTSEWVAFLDSDEFLVSDEPRNTIQSMIDAVGEASKASSVDCVAINWDWFANAAQFTWEDGLVVDRFTSAFRHNMKKCLFRPECATSLYEIHYPLLLGNAAVIDASGAAIADIKTDAPVAGEPLLRLNHYFAKSFQEFALKKIRGRGARAAGTELRPFEAFLWASVGSGPRAMNAPLRSALTKEMDRLLDIPEIRALNDMTQARARERVAAVDAEHNLRDIFQRLTHRDEASRPNG